MDMDHRWQKACHRYLLLDPGQHVVAGELAFTLEDVYVVIKAKLVDPSRLQQVDDFLGRPAPSPSFRRGPDIIKPDPQEPTPAARR